MVVGGLVLCLGYIARLLGIGFLLNSATEKYGFSGQRSTFG